MDSPLGGEDRSAHVFAILSPWGIGKSRLPYELVSQINDTSPDWYVRDAAVDRFLGPANERSGEEEPANGAKGRE